MVVGRGEVGRPIILECRFPRSECVTATFKPLLAAVLAALEVLAVGVLGVSGSDIRTP